MIFPAHANLTLLSFSCDLVTTISDHDQNRHFRTDHLQADLGGRSARGGAVTLSAQVFKFVFSTAATIVLARLLTPQDYGLIGNGSNHHELRRHVSVSGTVNRDGQMV